MGYGMKYTKGGFPFKASPAKQKENTTPHFLEKKTNPTTKAVEVDHSKTLSTHLDNRGPIKGDYQMENKGDFNISNLHKDAKISLKDKNYKKSSDLENNDDDRPYSIKEADAGNKQEIKEDKQGL